MASATQHCFKKLMEVIRMDAKKEVAQGSLSGKVSLAIFLLLAATAFWWGHIPGSTGVLLSIGGAIAVVVLLGLLEIVDSRLPENRVWMWWAGWSVVGTLIMCCMIAPLPTDSNRMGCDSDGNSVSDMTYHSWRLAGTTTQVRGYIAPPWQRFDVLPPISTGPNFNIRLPAEHGSPPLVVQFELVMSYSPEWSTDALRKKYKSTSATGQEINDRLTQICRVAYKQVKWKSPTPLYPLNVAYLGDMPADAKQFEALLRQEILSSSFMPGLVVNKIKFDRTQLRSIRQ